MSTLAYTLIALANGTFSIRSNADGETFHPVAGPVAEAEALYVRQLRLRERITPDRPFVVWDVGLGAGGNSLTAIKQLADLNASLEIISFDRTLEALRFALEYAAELRFPAGFEEPIRSVLQHREASFQHEQLRVRWEVCAADFPTMMADPTPRAAPDAIFFDAFSPARNAAMWTLPLFEQVFRRLDPQQPCALATFSRSTLARVTLLLAGFYVGAGEAVAGKEETTVASNTPDLIQRPLGLKWLERARASHNAEPLRTDEYRQAPVSPETWERLRAHPQF